MTIDKADAGRTAGRRVWQMPCQVTEKDARKAIYVASRKAQRPLFSGFWWLSVLLIVLAVCGGAALGILFHMFVGAAREITYIYIIVGGWAGFGVYLLFANSFVREASRRALKGPMNQGPRTLRLDAEGVTIEAGVARWWTAWRGVIGVFEARGLLVIDTGGSVLWLPMTDVAEGDRAPLVADVRGWHGAALGRV